MGCTVIIRGRTYTEAKLDCPECGRFMVLELRTNGTPYYRCSTMNWTGCSGTHSCHQESGAPLGTPGNRATKAARMRAHSAFDQLWKSGLMKRKESYTWLQQVMGMTSYEAHIGRFSIEDCKKLLTTLKKQKGIKPIAKPVLDLNNLDL